MSCFKLFKPLLIFACCLSGVLFSIGQTTVFPPGCNKTSRIEYNANKTLTLHDALTTSGGGRIAVGDFRNQSGIFGLKDNGDLLWARTFDQSFYETVRPRRLLRTKDGNYYVFSNAYFSRDHYAFAQITVTKIDETGNLIDSKLLDFKDGSSSIELWDIVAVEDGGFVMIITRNYGSGSTQPCYIVRFNADASIVWQRQMNLSQVTPLYKSVAVTKNEVILAWEPYDYYHDGWFGVDKLSLATGEVIWTKRYDTQQSHGLPTHTFINRVMVVNDTVFTFINYLFDLSLFNPVYHTLMVRLAPDGNALDAVLLKPGTNANSIINDRFDYLDTYQPSVTLSPEKDFVVAHLIREASGPSLNISKINHAGNAVWSKNYSSMGHYYVQNINPQGIGYTLVGRVGLPDPANSYITNGFILKVDQNGLTVNTASVDCAPVDAPFSRENIILTPDTDPNTTGYADIFTNFAVKPGNLTLQPLVAEALLYCHEPGNCSPITIEKTDKGCAVGDTLTYYLKDATNCDAKATWKYDPLNFKLVSEKSDTIQLLPLQKGLYKLSVDLEGNCFFRNEQININVLTSAREIELGKDTLLCPQSTIELKATGGYATYQWNDGSNLSKINVNTPGKYYLTVTDDCGGTGSDTIYVLDAGRALRLPTDTVKCNSDPILLTVTGGYTNYRWQPVIYLQEMANKAIVNPTTDTKYYAKADIWPGCTIIDSVQVTVLHSAPIDLGTRKNICTGKSLLLDAGSGFITYTWSTGAASQTINIHDPGKYDVVATAANGCQSKAAFELGLYPLPVPVLNNDPYLCEGVPKILQTRRQYNQYLWSDGSADDQLLVNNTGKYWVNVTDQNGCQNSDTTIITSVVSTPANFLPATAEICQYGKIEIIPNGNFKDYQWSDFSTASKISISAPGEYWLKVTDEHNCVGKDTITVVQKQCLTGLYVPNAFTPNGDGKNDQLKPMLFGNSPDFLFSIFNRWGQKVFETKIPGQGWDGTINSIPAASGTYIWYCRYTTNSEPQKSEKGLIELIK